MHYTHKYVIFNNYNKRENILFNCFLTAIIALQINSFIKIII